jgi:hypothetical protein
MPTGGAAGWDRITLATIRIVNGLTALFAPSALTRRLGVGPGKNHAIQYACRMLAAGCSGIRRIVIGIELLLPDSEVRAAPVPVAPVIDANDTAAAVAGLTRHMPPRAAITATITSMLNTVLALTARASEAAATTET